MVRDLLSWLRDVLSVDRSNAGGSREPEVERRPVGLFECTNCETTYIGLDRQSCSRCDGTVREIPNERDLWRFRSDDRSESPTSRDR